MRHQITITALDDIPNQVAGPEEPVAAVLMHMLGDAPDLHLLPLGNAGNITAYWAGYVEYREHGVTSSARNSWIDLNCTVFPDTRVQVRWEPRT